MSWTLPCAIDIEQSLLGAALFDNRHMESAALAPAHFFSRPHADLWAEMRRRYAAGEAFDPAQLREWWVSVHPDLGVKYLVTLMSAHLPSSIDGYCATLRDMAARREAIMALRGVLSDLEGVTTPVMDAVAMAEKALHAISAEECTDGAALPDTDGFFDRIDQPGLSTGIEALDRRLGGLFRKDLTIIAGRPSMGKTALAAQIARNVARHGKAVHFASLEMSKEGVQQRSISAATFDRPNTRPIPYNELRNGAAHIDRALLRLVAAGMPRTFWLDDRAAQTLAHLESSARATRRRFGKLDLIVVDYLQLMRPVRSDGRVQEVSEITAGLKAIAKRLDVPVVALSQLSRAVESRDNKRPSLSDLRDSGSIEQDADNVLFVYRESYYHERAEPDAASADKWREWDQRRREIARVLEAITAKQRMGAVGTDRLEAWLEFDTIIDRGAA